MEILVGVDGGVIKILFFIDRSIFLIFEIEVFYLKSVTYVSAQLERL